MNDPLKPIIPSKARRKTLAIFFNRQGENLYLRKIAREVDEEVNAIKRELDILSKGKILLKEKRLNKVFYTLNKNYRFFHEFQRIFIKQGFLATLIYGRRPKLGKLKVVALSTKFINRIPIKKDEIYILFVGVAVVPEVNSLIEEAEKNYNLEINYSVMTEEELGFRKKNNDPFIWRFLKQPKIIFLGSEEELMK